LLFVEAPTVPGTGIEDQERSHTRDLNLDQIVAAIAGDREERDLITWMLYAPLHDAGAVRYRHEILRGFEDPAKVPLPTSYGEDLYCRLGGWLDEDKALTPAASPDGEQWAWTLPAGPQAPADRQDERDRG
jgi:hypothetical protein